MPRDIALLKGGHSFAPLYLASFIISFHLYFVIYMNSSFLSTLIKEEYVGSVYIASAILSILTLLYISKILNKFGNYKTLVFLSLLEFFAFLGLAFFQNVYFLIPIFIGYSMLFPLILFNFDVFLEGYTKSEEETGTIRGTFLAAANLALILAPLVAGKILSNGDYWKIYLIAAVILLPFFPVIRKFRNFQDPKYHHIQIKQTFLCLVGRKNLYNIFVAHFLLRFFFSWMVIYLPIYLHGHIGFTWTEIGVLSSIVLLPFVIVEYPAGKLADKYLGEKELLILGFIILGIFTALLSLTTVKDFMFWVSLMFTIRVGASLVEIMSESYFFKHVDGTDNNTISFFRITRPFAYIVGPLVGTISLFFIDIQYIWIILSGVMLTGLLFSSRIKDTL